MAFSFSEADIQRIADVLGTTIKQDGKVYRLELFDDESNRRLKLEIVTGLALPAALQDADFPDNLVSAWGHSSFLQLQGVTGFIASQELGEVIFFAKRNDTTSGLVIEGTAGCSLYAHVDARLLSTDFTQLAPELVMSSVALSMTESLFDDLG
ncbi:MAG: hypothetical protein RhofKO_07070 [Rhodothermales bacterium]